MFTAQVGQLDKLEGKWPSEAIEVLRSILGTCAQELVHRGPVTFEGPVTTPGGSLSMLFAQATGTWVDGVTPYVMCRKMSGLTGTVSPDVIKLWLPRTSRRDPNVRAGDVLGYTAISTTEGMAATGYLDDKIGTVKWWSGTAASIPPGWELTAEGRAIFGYANGDPDFGTIDGEAGNLTHSHAAHDSAGVSAHSGHETGLNGATTVSLSGMVIGDTAESGTLEPTTAYLVATTTFITTSAEEYDLSDDAVVESEPVEVVDPGHDHSFVGTSFQPLSNALGTDHYPYPRQFTDESFTEMGIGGEVPEPDGMGNNVLEFTVFWPLSNLFGDMIDGQEHDHQIDMDEIANGLEIECVGHDLEFTTHSHSPGSASASLEDHSHTIPTLSHSGELEHTESTNLPPFKVYCCIKRVA